MGERGFVTIVGANTTAGVARLALPSGRSPSRHVFVASRAGLLIVIERRVDTLKAGREFRMIARRIRLAAADAACTAYGSTVGHYSAFPSVVRTKTTRLRHRGAVRRLHYSAQKISVSHGYQGSILSLLGRVGRFGGDDPVVPVFCRITMEFTNPDWRTFEMGALSIRERLIISARLCQ